MSKQSINMIGGSFQHDVCSSAGSVPISMIWDKVNHESPISIHVDHSIRDNPTDKSKRNYAWLCESKTIHKDLYLWCVNNVDYLENNFELIFTHDKSLLLLSDKIKLVICNARPWVSDIGIHTKSKMVSMVASNKVMCDEHVYRQEIIKKYRDRLDLFGRGFNPIPTKDSGIRDYRFSITMENGTYPLMFTEKITDCFAMGTIPIYWGCSEIGEVFDTNGIITLTDDFDPKELTVGLYESKMESIKNNYETTINLPTVEDYIYENYIK